jgi:hypothetical protein
MNPLLANNTLRFHAPLRPELTRSWMSAIRKQRAAFLTKVCTFWSFRCALDPLVRAQGLNNRNTQITDQRRSRNFAGSNTFPLKICAKEILMGAPIGCPNPRLQKET